MAVLTIGVRNTPGARSLAGILVAHSDAGMFLTVLSVISLLGQHEGHHQTQPSALWVVVTGEPPVVSIPIT